MAKKRDYDYFEMFVKGVAYSCKAAQMLEETLGHFDPDSLQIKLKDLHAVEHGADTVSYTHLDVYKRQIWDSSYVQTVASPGHYLVIA